MFYILLFIIIFSAANRWRGSDEKIKGIPFKWLGKAITVLALMVIYMHTTTNHLLSWWQVLLVIPLLYAAGEAPGWGKWTGTIYDRQPRYGKKMGPDLMWIHYIANLFYNEYYYNLAYTWLSLAIRGLFWWAPTLILFYLSDCISGFVLYNCLLALFFGFPLSYEIARLQKFPTMGKLVQSSWEKGEVVYGGCIGLVFGLIYYLGG